ncbi:right-handed parallel beta-helix repeat-containing protein [Aquimarina hainanensis]|uniref:Right-handed parallel beta-helix repeat-containing protein n=1 Tax=Aquimarina hainanensis TaxID=1578017 RepID=A0ABW5NEZ6_9FLAO
MRYLTSLLLLCILILWSSCRKDFEADPSTGNLEFSTDTLFLDTVFTNIGSSTYSFKVYNRTSNDLSIPSISLERGETSNYRLNVDGIAGTSFTDIQVLAKDSIFVFVETTTDITQQTNELEFLYTDKILFDKEGAQQDVDLVTLIKDATFLHPSRNTMTGEIETLLLGVDNDNNEIRIEGFILTEEQLHFTNEKPYVIYGYAAVPNNKTLTIDAGARIHFHQGSGLIVPDKATLLVNGAPSSDAEILENEVIIQGDRLEDSFSDTPGQWGTIWLTKGSTGHQITHTTIKNATVGILIDSNDGTDVPTLTIQNSQIYNSSNVGILAKTGHIKGENLVINNSGEVSLACTYGGRYDFNHCTFANYWGFSVRQYPAVSISNFIEIDENTIEQKDLIQADFKNCIIYGNEPIELLLSKSDQAAFNYSFEHCLVGFSDPQEQFKDNPLYDFSNENLYKNMLFNEDPLFYKPIKNKLTIDDSSPANGKASTPSQGTDITGTERSISAPDIGAYESAAFDDTKE